MLTKAEEKELRRRLRAESQIELVRLVEEAGIPPDLVSVQTAAALLNVTCSFVRRAIRRKTVEGFYFNNRLFVRLSDAFQSTRDLPRFDPNRYGKHPRGPRFPSPSSPSTAA